MHKYNLHKWLGLLIDDGDLRSIARVYGVGHGALKRIKRRFQENIARLAASLPPRQEKKLDPPIKILALGDSITSDRESYANILNRYWREDGTRTLTDCAISGDTTSDLLDRFYATVLNQEFDWVVILIGTNDCRQLNDEARISATSLEEYQRNLEYLIDRFQKRNKEVVLVTIPQVDNSRFSAFFPDSNNIYDQLRIERTNRFLRELAARKGLKLADLAAASKAQSEEVLEKDGVHINGAGHLILCRLLLDILP